MLTANDFKGYSIDDNRIARNPALRVASNIVANAKKIIAEKY
jgi:hypothetical protein